MNDTPQPNKHPPQAETTPPHLSDLIRQAEHDVEARVEAALMSAQQSIVRRFGRGCLKCVQWGLKVTAFFVLLTYFAFGAVLLITRHAVMPRIEENRQNIEAIASQLLDGHVSVGRLETSWDGINPRLKLSNVRLKRAVHGGGQPQEVLALPQVDATLSWSSLWRLQPRFTLLAVLAPELEVRKQADGRLWVAGYTIDLAKPPESADQRALDWLLGQRRIRVQDARIRYVDETVPETSNESRVVELENVQIRSEAGWRSNRLALRATPPAELSSPIDLRAEIQYPFYRAASRVNLWSGRIFAQADFVDLARLQSILGPASRSWQLYNAQGAIRAWVDFDQQSLRRAAADLALADVNLRLRGDLAPLALESLRGRFAYRQFGSAQAPGGQELVLEDFSMTGRAVELDTELAAADAVPLPRRLVIAPMQMRLRLTPANALRQVRGEFEASAISLGQLSALAAHIPLARQLRAVVARHAVSGELSQVSASWEGPIGLASPTQTITQWPKHYDIKAQFKHLSSVAVAAQPTLNDQGHTRLGLPGFQNLAGQIHLTEQLGTVRIQSKDITLEFPGLFEAPRKQFNTLEGTVQWRTDPTGLAPLTLQLERLTALNDAIDLTLSGTYQPRKQGPGSVNLSARIDRASAKHAHEYLPLAVSDHVRNWLQGALQAGTATQGSLKLRGNLSDFPYTRPDADGEFRVNARIRGGVLDIDPQRSAQQSQQPDTPVWPVLRDIDADIVFEGSLLSISARHAQTDNIALSDITAHIDNLGNAPRLQVSGALRGPLNELLRITARSPVGKPLGDALAGALASGDASGQLSLDLPLTHTDHTRRVVGSVRLKNNDIALRFLPTFTRASGQLDFTERSLKLTDIRAGFVGGQTAITADTLGDGRIIFKAQGTATPAGARHLTDIPAVQKVFDRSVGTANYNATITLANGKPDIRIESNLAGWGIDLPSPLGKLAGAPMPLLLRLAHSPTDPNKSHLQVNAGSVFSLRYERQHSPTQTQSARITRGSIRITDRNATEPTDFPDTGVRLTVLLDKLDLDRWARVWTGSGNLAGAGKRVRAALSDSGAPDLISAQVQQLRFAGKPIANVVLGASRAAEGSVTDTWLVNVDSDQASGALLIQPADENNSARIRARLARLTIPESQRTEFTELLDAPQSDMPTLDVIADTFELGKYQLGKLHLLAQNKTRRTAQGQTRDWALEKLQISNPDGSFNASGQWIKDPQARSGVRRMELNFTLDFSNGGALLTRLGIADALKATDGRLQGTIGWRGSPFSLDLPTLGGQINLDAQKGQFLKADAGAGRLLGVMSLQALPHRLTLDFRDIFSQGFAFDTLSADARIENGVLSTKNLRMRSVAATVLMEGSADLIQETQNLHVLVLPDINAGSASLLYAALANPAIGIGTFLAQMVLRQPLSKAFSFEYDVTGAWADPQVKRRKKPEPEDTHTSGSQ